MRPGGPIAVLRLRAMKNRLGESLFIIPAIMVVAGAGVGLAVDAFTTDTVQGQLPLHLNIGPNAARTLLSTIAGATITTVGVVFSILVISVQLGSAQFSPRIVRNFFRDWRSQVTVGTLGATFTYSVVALFSVGSNSAKGVPVIAMGVAGLLGVLSIMVIVSFLNHSARRLYVGNMAEQVVGATLTLIERIDRRIERDASTLSPVSNGDESRYLELCPPACAMVVRAPRAGWVQQVSVQALAQALDPGTVVRLETRAGAYVHPGGPIARVWPVPPEPDRVAVGLERAFVIGPERTMQQDVDYGLRQISDIALRALSPAVNDPHTAIEMVLRHGTVLHELLLSELPPLVWRRDGVVVVRAQDLRFSDYVEHAFDDIRRVAANQPAVAGAIMLTCRMLIETAHESGRPELASAPRNQIAKTLAGAEQAGLIAEDLVQLRQMAAG